MGAVNYLRTASCALEPSILSAARGLDGTQIGHRSGARPSIAQLKTVMGASMQPNSGGSARCCLERVNRQCVALKGSLVQPVVTCWRRMRGS